MTLDRILEVISRGGAGSLAALSAEVGVAESALTPMLDLLVDRGLLSDSARARSIACAGSCGRSCDPSSCVFVATPVRFFSVNLPAETRSGGGQHPGER